MKKGFWILAVAAVIMSLVSCSKKDSKPDNPGNGGGATNSVQVKIDGNVKKFTTAAAGKDEEDGDHAIVITGVMNSNDEESEAIIVTVVKHGSDIAKGEYVEGEHDDYVTFGLYYPQGHATTWGGGTAQYTPASPFKVKVTEVSATRIKGTFSGTFYDAEGTGENKIVMSEGSFDAPIQQ